MRVGPHLPCHSQGVAERTGRDKRFALELVGMKVTQRE